VIYERQIETKEVVMDVPGSVLALLLGEVQSEPEAYSTKGKEY